MIKPNMVNMLQLVKGSACDCGLALTHVVLMNDFQLAFCTILWNTVYL